LRSSRGLSFIFYHKGGKREEGRAEKKIHLLRLRIMFGGKGGEARGREKKKEVKTVCLNYLLILSGGGEEREKGKRGEKKREKFSLSLN